MHAVRKAPTAHQTPLAMCLNASVRVARGAGAGEVTADIFSGPLLITGIPEIAGPIAGCLGGVTARVAVGGTFMQVVDAGVQGSQGVQAP
jgi:hypothetical protein